MIQVLRRFETDNPYLQRVFAHPRFQDVSDRCRAAMDGLSNVDPDEKVLAEAEVNHGLSEQGFLILTTHFLRYVKAGRMFTVVKKNDLWSLEAGAGLDRHATVGVITTASGDNFQFQGRSRKNAKEFFELYQLAQLALRWDENQRRQLHDVAATSLVEAAATTSAASAPIKTCPRCAEEVKAAALVCRFCGHEFEVVPDHEPAALESDASNAGAAPRTSTLTGNAHKQNPANLYGTRGGIEWMKEPSGAIFWWDIDQATWKRFDARAPGAAFPPDDSDWDDSSAPNLPRAPLSDEELAAIRQDAADEAMGRDRQCRYCGTYNAKTRNCRSCGNAIDP